MHDVRKRAKKLRGLLRLRHADGAYDGPLAKFLTDDARAAFGLADGDHPVCCINIGTARSHKPAGRVRPAPSAFSSTLAQAAPPPGIPNARSPTLRPCE